MFGVKRLLSWWPPSSAVPRSPVRKPPGGILLPRWTLGVGAATVIALVSGCGADTGVRSESAAAPGTGSVRVSPAVVVTRVVMRPGMEHVHGLVVDRHGQILAGTHEGLFRVAGDGASTRVGSGRDDLMGLSTGAPGQLIASGHPGTGSARSDPLGVMSSQDGGLTWVSIPLPRPADFHALGARGPVIAGWDGSVVRISPDGGRTWREGARASVWSLTVSSDGIWATGPDGLSHSTDHGLSFRPVPGAPRLGLAGAGRDGTPWGVDGQGTVWTWEQVSGWIRLTTLRVSDSVSAIAVLDAHTAYVIVDGDLVRIDRPTTSTSTTATSGSSPG